MRRIRSVFALLGLMVVLTSAAAAQAALTADGTRATTPFVIDSTAHNNMLDAYIFHPNLRINATNADLATVEGSEPVHTCTGATGSNSIWLATYLPPGKLKFDTAGSSFVHSTGSTSDTVISLYKVTGDGSVVNFSTLAPMSCSAQGTDPGKLKLNIDEGTYVVQVSLEAAVTALSGSQFNLKVEFKPELKLKVDKASGAQELKFPKLYSFALAKHAVIESNEPVDLQLDPSVPLQKSVWFKFAIQHTMLITIIAQSSFGYGPASMFKVEANGSLTSVPYLPDTAIFTAFPMYALPAGEYRVRLAFPTIQTEIAQLSTYGQYIASIMIATANLTPVNYNFAATQEEMPGVVGTLEGWTVKDAGTGDELVCTAVTFRCGYQMTSSGVDEATTLVGKTKVSNVYLRRGEMVQIGVEGTYTGNGHIRMTVEMTDANGVTMVISKEFYPSSFGSILGSSLEPLQLFLQPKTIKITITNLSTTPGDTVFIDDVIVMPIRLGTPLPRGAGSASGLLPAPMPPSR